MSEQQYTIPGFGLDKLVPTQRLANDLVECSDGSTVCHCDVYYDVNGGAHSNEEDRFDAERDLVEEFFKGAEKWYEEYVESDDYGNGYAYVACEVSHDWPARIDDWLIENGHEYDDKTAQAICEEIANSVGDCDIEARHHCNEYADYDGPGIGIYSLDIGECEDQIEVASHELLSELDESGRLEGLCEALDREFCFYRFSRYDRLTGRRVEDDIVHRGMITVYWNPGGQWQYFIPEETAKQALADAIVTICRRADSE